MKSWLSRPLRSLVALVASIAGSANADESMQMSDIIVFHLGDPPAAPAQVFHKVNPHPAPLNIWPGEDKPGPLPGLTIRQLAPGEVPIPEPEYLRLFGHGIDAVTEKRLRASRGATLLTVWRKPGRSLPAIRSAQELALKYAEATDGLIWDQASRECFSPKEWRLRRIQTWAQDVPSMGTQVVQHLLVSEPGTGRTVTIGMSKFGLPDFVIEGHPGSMAKEASDVLHLVVQVVAEAKRTSGDKLIIETSKLPTGLEARGGVATKLVPGQLLKLPLKPARPKGGDPEFLLELAFKDPVHLAAVHAQLFGSKRDLIMDVHNDDAEMEQARATARKQLWAIKDRFTQAQEQREVWQIKAIFPVNQKRNEVLWFDLQRWQGGQLSGILSSNPEEVSLKKGASVSISEDDVYDYRRSFPDGHSEGGLTDALLNGRR